MTSTHPESLHPGARTLPRSGARRHKASRGFILRLAIGTLAVLVLIALGALGPKPTSTGSSVEPIPAPAPALDGRGKWSGYTH